LLDWTFLGPVFGTAGNSSYSRWSGNYGFNYETASVRSTCPTLPCYAELTCAQIVRLNASGRADDDGTDTRAIDVIGVGTEAGRQDHEAHWPLWVAGHYVARANGSAELVPVASGVYDWGEVC
jgi:beta-fructofuranosidase